MEKLEDKIKVGADVVIFCLAEKPNGKIISVSDKTVSIEFDKGVMIVDKDDIINSPDVLQVLNYIEIKDIKFNRSLDSRGLFEDTMMKTSEKFSGGHHADIYGMFMDYIVNTIDNSGSFYPIPCMFDVVKDGKSGIAMAGIAMEQHHGYSAVATLLLKEHPTELLFSVIKETHSESDIDPKKFKFTLCVFRLNQTLSLGGITPTWSYGVVGFNDAKDFKHTDIVWDNKFWIERMEALLVSAFIIKAKDKIGKAYKDRIEIKKWMETPHGYLYEGLVLVDKLDKKTKTFLEENKLDPNDKKQITEFFKSNDMELDFMKSDNGLVNLMVTNTGYFFMDRRSKTRAVLEAIETIANKPKERKAQKKKAE